MSTEELQQLVSDLWEARGYGIAEIALWERVCRAVPDRMFGLRAVDKQGLSIVPRSLDSQVADYFAAKAVQTVVERDAA